jgi:hypothetical protein
VVGKKEITNLGWEKNSGWASYWAWVELLLANIKPYQMGYK